MFTYIYVPYIIYNQTPYLHTYVNKTTDKKGSLYLRT